VRESLANPVLTEVGTALKFIEAFQILRGSLSFRAPGDSFGVAAPIDPRVNESTSPSEITKISASGAFFIREVTKWSDVYPSEQRW
jgi:hypothetical protein